MSRSTLIASLARNILTWSIFFALLELQVHGQNLTNSSRHGKLFSLFNVVTFNNGPCTGTGLPGSTAATGICFTASECISLSGTTMGSCASGFGVCCTFVLNSAGGGTVTQNGTILQAPMSQTALADGMNIAYQVNRISSDVCFLRLDFQTFTILGPMDTLETNGGQCVDTFTATTKTGTTTICGENSGEHIYVDFGMNPQSMLTFNFGATPGGTTIMRDWDIKVNQIPCTGPTAPPIGCLQYHTTLMGQIKSFNFDGNTGHLANQRYSACIRQAADHCCVEFRVCPAPIMNAFTLDSTVGTTETACFTELNPLTPSDIDYIGIAGSSSTCSMTQGIPTRNIYCGTTFNLLATAPNAAVCGRFSNSTIGDNLGFEVG
eukprot:TCALIF_03427-PB protein Name:"Protein of unknown function" AED:0.12 eAED:0.12 QI:15/1/0.9/1/0.11/0.4/10/0/376